VPEPLCWPSLVCSTSSAQLPPGGWHRCFANDTLRVLLDESDMVVKSGNVVTAGAALGHMDLALWLIRGVSPELASLTAKYLIVDSRPSQTAYALTDHLIHSDSVVHRFERWARARLARGFSLDSAARAVGASKRTVPPTIAPTGCAVRRIGRGPDGRLWLVVERREYACLLYRKNLVDVRRYVQKALLISFTPRLSRRACFQ
jgi:hypothetical protein